MVESLKLLELTGLQTLKLSVDRFDRHIPPEMLMAPNWTEIILAFSLLSAIGQQSPVLLVLFLP